MAKNGWLAGGFGPLLALIDGPVGCMWYMCMAWPTTAIRQNNINLLILDSTLIIL